MNHSAHVISLASRLLTPAIALAIVCACGASESSHQNTSLGGSAGISGATATVGGDAGSEDGSSGKGGATQSGGASGLSNHDEPLQDLMLASVVVGSCVPDTGINRMFTRMLRTAQYPLDVWGRARAHASCLAHAKNGCQALETCLGARVEQANLAEPRRCEGTTFIETVVGEASPGITVRMDCARFALECDGDAGCIQSPVEKCEASSIPVCSDGRPKHCIGGYIAHGIVCEDLGLECAEHGRCRGTGFSCSGGFAEGPTVGYGGLQCAGTEVVACVDARATNLNCRSMHPELTCQTRKGFVFCGLDAQCVPGEMYTRYPGNPEATCDGANISICAGGRIANIDCKSLGFTGCTAVRDGAACTPGLFSP